MQVEGLRFRNALIGVMCGFTAFAVAAAPALAGFAHWANPVGPVVAGSFSRGGDYHGTIQRIAAQSTGTAYAGAYAVNSSGARVSADMYCNSPGCLALITWYGPYPEGFAAVHNHGNASPSWFDGSVWWL